MELRLSKEGESLSWLPADSIMSPTDALVISSVITCLFICLWKILHTELKLLLDKLEDAMAGWSDAVQLLKLTEIAGMDSTEIKTIMEDTCGEVQPTASVFPPHIPAQAVQMPQGCRSLKADKGPTLCTVSWGSGAGICAEC